MVLRQLYFLFLLCLSGKGQSGEFQLNRLRKAVFKIRTTYQSVDYSHPWKSNPVSFSTGTGFSIGEGMILTNAHVVTDARLITIQRDGEDYRQEARVVHIAHDADLALIKPVDPNFMKDDMPIPLGGVPSLLSQVSTVGYPSGGEQLSITQGIVSRISYRTYIHARSSRHLLVQVDSAINPGNSGGPVIQDGKVIGVAFQTFTKRENTGFIIPTPVIERFLLDIKDGSYDGHPQEGIHYQRWELSTPAVRRYYQLDRDMTGVRVMYLDSDPMWSVFQRGDVILKIDSYPIGGDGTILFHGERVDFRVVSDLKQVGEKLVYLILRDGKTSEVEVKVVVSQRRLLESYSFEQKPRYAIFAGLVFIELSQSYLRSLGQRVPDLLQYIADFRSFDPNYRRNKDFVVVADVLAHPVNSYAQGYVNSLLLAVNGKRVRSFASFVSLVKSLSSGKIRLDFKGGGGPLVFDAADMRVADEDIQKRYGIPAMDAVEISGDNAIAWEEK